jgi:hypothetical protein
VGELLIRFFAGGIVVSAFAFLADVLRPKSFAGLFGAAPSVALVSLSLAIPMLGPGYVAAEGRSMMIGAAALCAFSVALVHLLMKARLSALNASFVSFAVWLVVSFVIFGFLRR